MTLKINNHHNVYILGAGFSASRGLPLIKDFMIALRDAHPWLVEHSRVREAEAVTHVLEYRLDSAPAGYRISIDLENIEELFSLADTGKDMLSQDIRIAIAATLDYKASVSPEPTTNFSTQDVSILPKEWRNDRSSINHSVPFYQFCAYSLLGKWTDAKASSAFLTFNYDCLLEDALRGIGVGFEYGIRTHSANKLDVANVESTGERVSVLKLHGSVNWMRESRSKPLQIVNSYREVMNWKGIPEIVPPTWRKLFAKELVTVWKAALAEIERGTRIVVIGFSMPETDLHFKYLLASGLRRNVSLREIVFVDPNLATIADRAGRLFGDLYRRPSVRIVEARLTQFVSGGTLPEKVHSIDRGIPQTISSPNHSVL